VIGAARRQARPRQASLSSGGAAAPIAAGGGGGGGGEGGKDGKGGKGENTKREGGASGAGWRGEELQRQASVARHRAEIARSTASQLRERMDAMERETRRRLLVANPELREQHTQVSEDGEEGGREGGKGRVYRADDEGLTLGGSNPFPG
jgi:hypothetical protein